MDQLVEFVSELPAWLNEDGLPKTWKHFGYGLAYIRRKHARETLRMSDAGRMNNVDSNDYRDWRSIHVGAARF